MSSFCNFKSYSHFFSKSISLYAIFNDQSFNNMLTNDIVSFQQLGPGCSLGCLTVLNTTNLIITTNLITVSASPCFAGSKPLSFAQISLLIYLIAAVTFSSLSFSSSSLSSGRAVSNNSGQVLELREVYTSWRKNNNKKKKPHKINP